MLHEHFQLEAWAAVWHSEKECFPWTDLSPSCLALNDLIRGRQADDLIDHLAEIWETLFRVLDDIKVSVSHSQCCFSLDFIMCLWAFASQESVRKAADLTLKTLSKVTLLAALLASVTSLCLCAHPNVSHCPRPGVHSHVRVNRLGSPTNRGGDVTDPAGKRHHQQRVRGSLFEVTAHFPSTCPVCLSVKHNRTSSQLLTLLQSVYCVMWSQSNKATLLIIVLLLRL